MVIGGNERLQICDTTINTLPILAPRVHKKGQVVGLELCTDTCPLSAVSGLKKQYSSLHFKVNTVFYKNHDFFCTRVWGWAESKDSFLYKNKL